MPHDEGTPDGPLIGQEKEGQAAKKTGNEQAKAGRLDIDKGSKIAPMVSAVAHVIVMLIQIGVLWTVFHQFQLNKDLIRHNEVIADRVWSAQLVASIYEVQCTETKSKEADKREESEESLTDDMASVDQGDDSPETSQAAEAVRQECRPKAAHRSREEAVLAYIKMQRGYGERIKLAEANLERMDLSDKQLSSADLRKAILDDAELKDSGLEGADLTEANLVGAKLNGAHLGKALLSRANLRGAHLEDADLRGAQLDGAELGVCGAQFDDATGDVHISANLQRAKLKGAIFNGTSMCGVDIRGTDLSQVRNLSQEQIDVAIGDDKTGIPDHVTRPPGWEPEKQ